MGKSRGGAGRSLGRPVLLTSGTSVLAVAAIAAALLVPRDADPLPARDLGPLALLSEDAAMEQARSSGTPVVATALTTSTTKITARPDGMFDAEISPMPVRVLDDEGVWHDIDNTLVRRADGSIGPARPAVNMSFSGGGTDPLAALADTDRSLALSWPTPLPEPTLVGSAAHYESVVPGVDLVARAGTTGFSTYVVVHTPEAAQHPLVRDLAFEVAAVGVQVSDTRGGTVVAKEGTETVFRASQPLAWESSETTAGPAASSSAAEEEAVIGAPLSAPVEAETVPMTVEASNTSLELAPKSDLLTDPDTTWPVVLDPGFTTGGVGDQIQRWGMVWSSGTNFYDHPTEDARVGYDGWSSAPKKSRVFYRFNTAPIVGKKIHLAQLQHSLIHTPNNDCNVATYGPNVQVWRTGVIGSTLSWSNQPAWIEQQDADNLAHGNEQYCTGADQQNFNVRAMIRDIAAAGETSANIGMKSGDEADKNGWRRYNNSGAWPRLYVAYSHTPTPPAALTLTPKRDRAADGIWTNTLNPALSANVSAPNGGTAYVRFEIWSGASLLWTANSGSGGNGTSVTTTVPSGKLAHGGTYTLKAYSVAPPDPNYAADGPITSAPSSVTFKVDIVAPPAPKVVKEAGMCRVAVKCYFDFTPQSADTVAYRYSLNTDNADGAPVVGKPGITLRSWVIPQSFGPGWLVAAAEDLAGNISSQVDYVDDVKIHGSVMGHHWNLDDSGADQVPSTATPPGAALTTPALPTAAGRLGTEDWTATVPDATDKALDVNGSGARAANLVAANHNAGQDFSVSAWVKLPATGTATDGVVMSQRAAPGSYDAWILGYSGGNWIFAMSSGNTWYTAYLTTAPPRNRWIHIAGLFDYHRLSGNRQLSLFIDGREVSEVPFPAEPHAVTNNLWVGAGTTSSAPARPWPGQIDDVRTFPGVLDASQIRRIIAEHRRS